MSIVYLDVVMHNSVSGIFVDLLPTAIRNRARPGTMSCCFKIFTYTKAQRRSSVKSVVNSSLLAPVT